MALALRKPSFIRSVVIVAFYLVIICVNELGVVRSAGAPAYPPAESPVSSASTPTPIDSPAFIPVPPPALAPARSLWYSECGPWPVKHQAYKWEAMLSIKKAWNVSSLMWNQSVHPCDASQRTPRWNGVFCRAMLVDHNYTKGTVSETFLYWLKVKGPSTYVLKKQIIGELVPEIGDLRNLEYLNIRNNPGLTGPIPASIWNLPNLKYLYLSENSLTGRVVLDHTMSSIDSLEYIYLDGNNLSESFNLAYGWLDSREAIYLSLQTLELSNNFLNDLRGFAYYMPPIRTIRLRSNLLTTNLMQLSDFDFVDSSRALDLSNNKIGHLPDWSSIMRGHTSALSELILDHNFITGDFDISAVVESNISESLTVLSLQYNQITNVVYVHDFAGVRTKFLLQGNPYCFNTWTSEIDALRCSIYCEHNCTYEDPNTDSGKSWTIIVATTTSSPALLLLFATLCFALVLRRNTKYIRALQKKIRKADINAKRFEYSDLRAATRNFAPEMKLGAGAYGAVYKGILPNNDVVAVKQLFLETDEDRDDVLNEVLLISNLQHRNLVNLRGYCLRGKQMLLVYEYVDNYDLDKLLFSSHNSIGKTLVSDEGLNWQARMKVCQGVAQGLYYLHASSRSRIIHRDIKASNIMLDKNLRPKIADFGLARPIEDARSVIVTQKCAGTLGYLAPEYMCHGQLSEKADIYSFGVLLLEIVSGKRNRDFTMPEDEVYLPSGAWKLHREYRLLDMRDAALVVSEDEAVEVQLSAGSRAVCAGIPRRSAPPCFKLLPSWQETPTSTLPPLSMNTTGGQRVW